jgi:hypothetical protein
MSTVPPPIRPHRHGLHWAIALLVSERRPGLDRTLLKSLRLVIDTHRHRHHGDEFNHRKLLWRFTHQPPSVPGTCAPQNRSVPHRPDLLYAVFLNTAFVRLAA